MKGRDDRRELHLGQNVFVSSGVVIGNNVKVQNNVAIYTGTVIEDDVFLGPSCVLTNVSNPRSQVVRHDLYERTIIRRGATVGANATIACGIELGRYCFIGAGAVVTRMCRTMLRCWACRTTDRLGQPAWDSLPAPTPSIMVCPESGYRYRKCSPAWCGCLDLDEEAPLPRSNGLERCLTRTSRTGRDWVN
jgi:UDP-2-acetamido-3-amino-2,3-dideoxy-glucuronate N-acetyltransferase